MIEQGCSCLLSEYLMSFPLIKQFFFWTQEKLAIGPNKPIKSQYQILLIFDLIKSCKYG